MSAKSAGYINRSRAAGLNLYCDRECSDLRRRNGKSKAQKRSEKRLYDIEYRAKNFAMLKVKKHEHFKRTYDPEKARIERKKRSKAHVEYCRRPEYRKWKQTYDRKHLAKKVYGPFAEAAMLVADLNKEIKVRMTNAEIKWKNGSANKAQFRRRDAKEETRIRKRHRERRPGHTAINS